MSQSAVMTELVMDRVHVWHVRLSGSAYLDDMLLSDSEMWTMKSYLSKSAATQFGAVRCCLRVLLGAYLGQEPGGLELGNTVTGRPFLKVTSGKALRFSVAHSGEMALIAVGICSVGVDVEEDPPQRGLEAIVDLVFSDEEKKVLQSIEAKDRATLILRGWTRKEAVAKALGVGFLIDPRSINVALDESHLSLATVRGHWTLDVADLSFPGAHAAIAGSCIPARPRLRTFPPKK